MESFIEKILNSEFVIYIKDFFAFLAEKIEGIHFLHRTPSKKVIIACFSVIIALLVLISAVSVISAKKKESTDAVAGETTTEITEQEYTAEATKEINSNFLFALTDNDKTDVHSIIVVYFNSEEGRMQLTFVEPETSVSVNDLTGNMPYHLQTGGISQFLWAISEHTGQGFNRYLIIDEEGFTGFMGMLGETEIEIPESISFNHDGISFIIDEGPQKLTADMMLKYCIYLGHTYSLNKDRVIEVLSLTLEKLFTADTDEKLEQRFCDALGYFTTDISAIDFSEHKSAIKAIPQMQLSDNASAVDHKENH
ncbi:MAG: hypothetical protein UHM85_05735 [Acutalibacteraceae bacterium]|nr:hypothetical protein [Acutalibacteraceae bacterium]